MKVLDTFQRFYADLQSADIDELDNIYTHDAQLIDPIGEHEKLPHIKRYFERLLATTTHCSFDIHNIVTNEIEPKKYVAFVSWTMKIKTKSSDKSIFVQGSSELKICNDLIYFHRDYFDLGQMIYERIPIMSWFIKQIKKRLLS